MRLVYFLYYLKRLDWKLYFKFSNFLKKNYNRSFAGIMASVLYNSLKYNISILEYFQFHFYKLPQDKKKEFAGTGYMYEYQKLMNPVKYRDALEDKRKFLVSFNDFVNHEYGFLNGDDSKIQNVLNKEGDKVVIKNHDGQCGIGVKVLNKDNLDLNSIKQIMNDSSTDIIEEYIIQHDDLMKLSPSGLNSIRVFTQLNDENQVEILGSRIRISVNSIVDNMAAGNLAAEVNSESGMVTGKGFYSDITMEPVANHPITGQKILGFQIPYWKETKDMVIKAQLHIPECRSIGWDVAITNSGPQLIEGNHDWCKLVWQIPVQKGLKSILEKHKTSYISYKKNQ